MYWDWKEKDTFDIWFPDFDTGVGVAGVSPQGLTRTSNWVTWDKPGCTVRFRTTTTVYFEQ